MKKILLLALAFISLCAAACREQAIIPALPAPVTIAVAPYNQPTNEAQLLAGYIPKEQGLASAVDFARYNELLKAKLQKTQRNYIFLTQSDLSVSIQ